MSKALEIESCGDCPNRIRWPYAQFRGMWVCAALSDPSGTMQQAPPPNVDIPSWCPLPEYEEVSNESD